MPMRRAVKNIVNNYTEAEVRVREATSNDPWGPSSTLMSEIADLTYNVVAFAEIMAMIWKRLNDHGKNWRHVYKSLTLLEYIIKTGSEKVGQQCKENIYAVQTLKDFQHMEDNKDLGANVREKAKALVSLLKDEERLMNERTKALKAKERFTENFGIGSDSTHTQLGKPKHGRHGTHKDESHPTASPLTTELEEARPHSAGEEQLQLELALAMSKEEAETVAEKKNNDDVKLQLALEESKKLEDSDKLDQQGMPELGGLGVTGGPANDPWNASAPSAPANPANPWSPVPTASLTASQNPWSPPATVQSNPWEATPAKEPTSDPWGDNAPNAAPANTWGSAPLELQAAAAPSSDPWLTTSSSNGAQPISRSVVDTDFELLSMRQPNSNAPPANQMATMSLMDNPSLMNPSLIPPPVKKPEDFLDPHSKNLVNLDSLVTKSTAPGPGASNPFAMTAVGQDQPPVANPFTANQAPRPSLNQMSQAAVPGFTQQQQMLPNPMMPTGGFAPVGYNQPPMGYQQPPFQPQQTNVNPFL